MSSVAGAVPRAGHVFLSHAGDDTEEARRFAGILRHHGLDVWFDKDSLQPGDQWITAVETAIQDASAMIVYVGSAGVHAWMDRKVRFGLERNTRDPQRFRLIPVLGEGAKPEDLRPFLTQQQYADLRDRTRAPEEIARLLDILRDPAAASIVAPEYWIKNSPFRGLRAFDERDSWLFFGRDAETDQLIDRVHREPVLMVIGNSGSGPAQRSRPTAGMS